MNNSYYPKISIVMPSFNQINYIEASIKSILSQDYENLELFIIDGGSNDGTTEIIKKYSKHLSYWHSKKDNGQTDALIIGFSKATGDIMGWINSDDILLPNTLDSIAEKYMANKNTGIFYGNYFLIDKNDYVLDCKRVPKRGVKYFANHGHWIFGSTGTFFSRSAYDRSNGLNVNLTYVMDADLYMRMMANNEEILYINKYVGAFRRHDDAKTVYGIRDSREEYNAIAQKSWSKKAKNGRSKKRWIYLYKLLQIFNGNISMFYDKIKYKNRKWSELPLWEK